jgi:hypothetical protein
MSTTRVRRVLPAIMASRRVLRRMVIRSRLLELSVGQIWTPLLLHCR